MGRLIAVTARGSRVGQDHHRAKLSNAQIDALLALRDEGWSYGRLCIKFSVPKASVAAWCQLRRRATTPDKFVRRE